MNKPGVLQDQSDFSLVLGGPLFQLFRRAHLSGNTLELLHRRILLLSLITWLPLLLLSVLEGRAFDGGGVKLPFLHDLETHVRFLVALPVLIGAELIVHLRIRPVVQQFMERGVIVAQDVPSFHAAVSSAIRARNSVFAEVALLVLVFTVGNWVWRNQIAVGTASWYATSDGTGSQITAAGYWFAFFSIPIFQFILLRWYFRLGVWFWFLWKVSRLNLNLISTHPDKAGGLAFLGRSAYAFGPILFAQGAMLAGLIATRVLFSGANPLSFKMEAGGMIGFFILFVLGPLVMFTPQLARAKRRGLGEYGVLASLYVQEFEKKWVDGSAAVSDELLGNSDVQSLANLDHSYGIVRDMRLVPFGLDDVMRLAAATAAPLLPLGLTIFSPEELIMRLVGIVF